MRFFSRGLCYFRSVIRSVLIENLNPPIKQIKLLVKPIYY